MAELKVTVTINKSKAFLELAEIAEELEYIFGLIPEWNQYEARPIADKIYERIQNWVEIREDME